MRLTTGKDWSARYTEEPSSHQGTRTKKQVTACDMDSIQQKIAHQGKTPDKRRRVDQQTTVTPMVCTYQASNQLQAEQT